MNRSRKASAPQKRTPSDRELIALAAASKAHKWLEDPSEDIYSLNDGHTASWPKKPINGAA
ncbi:MAG: hypothetical protein Q8922_09065 [Bacteroidota bacterium]|nr:hypothetical protein [Bacteroidota bacterium]MDP4234286.1 hypothetical protein [Bacteroidota bacterium]MDP4243221.1 hypothetical protein [Bacteroidota bacterium]MDP4288073.1 hypothetical protein [Bacteroidota bacterium]